MTDPPTLRSLRVISMALIIFDITSELGRPYDLDLFASICDTQFDTQFDTQLGESRWILADESDSVDVGFKYENDPGGLRRTARNGNGIQKVGGSTPPGSTNFRIQI